MAKLILSAGGAVVQQYFVDKDRMTIGRDAGNDIVIDDLAVSRIHAAIVTVGNDRIVEDLQSSNGTLVNGVRVTRQILKHGDVLDFGTHHLRYVNPKAAAQIGLEQTMMIATVPDELRELRQKTGENATPQSTGLAARSDGVRFPRGRAKFFVGPRAPDVVELDRIVATIGTSGKCLAVITRRPHGYFITHVDGKRYARVNRQPIGKAPRALRNHDVIEAAGDKLEFLLD